MPRASTRSKRPSSWVQLKQHIAKLDAAELLKLVRDLHDLSAENRQFLSARFRAPDGDIDRYRRQIADAIYPDPFSRRPISIAPAKRVIRQYELATADPAGVIDLRLTFVEQGTAQAVDLAFGDDGYFDSLQSMLDTVLQLVHRLPIEARGPYISRLVHLREYGRDVGWGYGDFLAEMLEGISADDS